MAEPLKIINLEDSERAAFGRGEGFSAALVRIGALLGMRKLGCTLVELEPGKRAWPYHLHYGQEELFVILQGEGTLRYDDERHAIREGDVFFTPTGEGTAHQIINTSQARLRYLAMSSMDEPEVCYYPDSGKYGCWSQEGKVTFLAHQDTRLEYWDGES